MFLYLDTIDPWPGCGRAVTGRVRVARPDVRRERERERGASRERGTDGQGSGVRSREHRGRRGAVFISRCEGRRRRGSRCDATKKRDAGPDHLIVV